MEKLLHGQNKDFEWIDRESHLHSTSHLTSMFQFNCPRFIISITKLDVCLDLCSQADLFDCLDHSLDLFGNGMLLELSSSIIQEKKDSQKFRQKVMMVPRHEKNTWEKMSDSVRWNFYGGNLMDFMMACEISNNGMDLIHLDDVQWNLDAEILKLFTKQLIEKCPSIQNPLFIK
jgi:hypothetical protein